MYGEQDDARDDRPVSPRGVRIVIIILLVSGLALVALPLTVLLTGGHEPGHVTIENASGSGVDAPRAATDDTSRAVHDAAPAGAEATETARGGPYEIPDGWSEKWRPWFANVNWEIGADAGMACARATGKPMMMFYTATW